MLLRTVAAQTFITCDAPARLIWATKKKPTFAPGYGLRNTDFRLPLTPYLALSAKFEDGFDETVDVNEEYLGHFNRGTLMAADRFVFHHAKEFFFLTENNRVGTLDDAMALHKRAHDARTRSVSTVKQGDAFVTVTRNPNAALDS